MKSALRFILASAVIAVIAVPAILTALGVWLWCAVDRRMEKGGIPN